MHLEAMGVLRRHVGIPPRGKEAAHRATRYDLVSLHWVFCNLDWKRVNDILIYFNDLSRTLVTLAAIHVCFHVKQMNDIDASIQQYEWETRSPVLTIPWPEPPCSKRQEPRVYVLWSYESYVIPVQPIHTISYLRFISNLINLTVVWNFHAASACPARHGIPWRTEDFLHR